MITKDEIIRKADEFEIHAANVQRDYVFSWVLAGLYSESSLQDQLILKGGNCLRKAYFDHSRFSRDLDFSTKGSLAEEFIGTELNRICDFVQEHTGIVFEKEKTRVEEKRGATGDKKVHEARLYFKDFFGNPDKFTISIRLDVTEFDKIFLPTQKRNLNHPYSDLSLCKVPLMCLKLEEILAQKLKCLLQRRHSPDLYDFVFSVLLNPEIEINKTEIVTTFLKMTIFQPSPGVVKGLLFDLPFQTIKSFWNKYITPPKLGVIDYDHAVQSFKETINDLFGAFPIGRGEQMFFPSHFRNPIMEAGQSMTLLEIRYSNVSRLVEPYCLAYKKRKDGFAREYLYVYDQTGGSSGPGIKSLVHSNIQELKNTDTKFEPRYEVELCKAGETLKSSYFAKSSGRRSSSFGLQRPTKRLSTIGFNSTFQYTVQCPVCGKKFKRKKYDTKLNQHKDQYGNRCYGRTGYIV